MKTWKDHDMGMHQPLYRLMLGWHSAQKIIKIAHIKFKKRLESIFYFLFLFTTICKSFSQIVEAISDILTFSVHCGWFVSSTCKNHFFAQGPKKGRSSRGGDYYFVLLKSATYIAYVTYQLSLLLEVYRYFISGLFNRLIYQIKTEIPL